MAELTPKQARAVAELAAGRSQIVAAAAAGVAAKTVRRWAQMSAFREALKDATADALAGAVRVLAGNAVDASSVLADVMNDGGAKDSDRISAADRLLRHAASMTALIELEDRVAELEKRAKGKR